MRQGARQQHSFASSFTSDMLPELRLKMFGYQPRGMFAFAVKGQVTLWSYA